MCVHTQKCLSLYVPIHCLYVEFTAQSLNAHQTFLQLHVLCLHLLKWHLWIALIYDPGYERNVSLCAGPQQKHNTSGSDITLLYMMYIQYKLICVISAANTSSESANRGAMGTTDDLTKPNNRWCWFTVRTMCYVCYHIHIYMMSPQTGPRPKQTGSLSLTHTSTLHLLLPPSLQECARATCPVCLATSDWWDFYPGLQHNVYDPTFEFLSWSVKYAVYTSSL